MDKLQSGIRAERTYEVAPESTAAALMQRDAPDGGTLPAVWSTPDMIGKMEVACAALVAPLLGDGQMTVGSRNEISHLAPTPEGARVRVAVVLQAVEGRKLTFVVEAFDDRAKVGEGVHIRFVVDRARFEERLRRG